GLRPSLSGGVRGPTAGAAPAGSRRAGRTHRLALRRRRERGYRCRAPGRRGTDGVIAAANRLPVSRGETRVVQKNRNAPSGHIRRSTFPTMEEPDMGPHHLLSHEFVRLSPRTKYIPEGTLYGRSKSYGW